MPIFSKEKSKIKMVILTHGREPNAVWWSPINQNERKSELVILSMLRRFQNHALYSKTRCVQFYQDNVLLAEYKQQ